MRVLFDHGTPSPLSAFLGGHSIQKTQDLDWDRLSNGELLEAAEAQGFDVLITTDKNIRHQQNLSGRRIAIVVLGNAQWPVLKLHAQRVVEAVRAAAAGSYQEVSIPTPAPRPE
jgi:hypothetical protein